VEAETDLTVEAWAMRRITIRIIAAGVAACALSGTAEALVFDRVSRSRAGDRAVLWVRDCGSLGDGPCSETASRFTEGDAATLEQELRRARYDEIWLNSGGGDLLEGIRIGHLLRAWQATVRVPQGATCASACTVAFLGGLFRFVDTGGTYEVHAGSVLLRGFRGRLRHVGDQLLGGSERDTEDALAWFAEWKLRGEPVDCAVDLTRTSGGASCQVGARGVAAALFAHFQAAIVPLGEQPGSGPVLRRWLYAGGTPLPYSREQIREDVARIRREGEAAAQEILMRLERDTMAHAIAQLEAVAPSLGPRARPALQMLAVMYSKRIAGGAADVSPATLLQMGYVTQLFDPTRP
jgi:hypothetical protein